MREALERLIERVLRVPSKPDPPFGAADTLRTFRAGRGFLHYNLALWGLRQLGTIVGIVFGLYWIRSMDFEGFLRTASYAAEAVAVGAFLAFLPFSFLMVTLDFRYRWYMVSDRSLRIREGLMQVKEKTMTFKNIQNLSIRQGPIQRLFGIADLEVRTAGGGAGQSPQGHQGLGEEMHVATFRGVDDAESIRDLIYHHLETSGGAGLGDPDESDRPTPATPATGTPTTLSPDLLGAARELLGEVQALRREAGGVGLSGSSR